MSSIQFLSRIISLYTLLHNDLTNIVIVDIYDSYYYNTNVILFRQSGLKNRSLKTLYSYESLYYY